MHDTSDSDVLACLLLANISHRYLRVLTMRLDDADLISYDYSKDAVTVGRDISGRDRDGIGTGLGRDWDGTRHGTGRHISGTFFRWHTNASPTGNGKGGIVGVFGLFWELPLH